MPFHSTALIMHQETNRVFKRRIISNKYRPPSKGARCAAVMEVETTSSLENMKTFRQICRLDHANLHDSRNPQGPMTNIARINDYRNHDRTKTFILANTTPLSPTFPPAPSPPFSSPGQQIPCTTLPFAGPPKTSIRGDSKTPLMLIFRTVL